MSLTSSTEVGFDTRLLEIEELYRQRKPDIASEKLQVLKKAAFTPEGFELGLFKSLQASDYSYCGDYQKAIKYGLEANRLLASSALHKRVGRVQWLLYRNYAAVGDFKTAEIFARDAYATFRRCSEREGMIDALTGLGRIAFTRCDFSRAIEYVDDAIALSKGDNVRMARLIGNLGRVETFSGDYENAESHLKTSVKLARDLDQPLSIAKGHLSLGYLYLRQRQFILASREFKSAAILFDKHPEPFDQYILAEYNGELALEMGDIVQAKKILTKAYADSRELAPESNLISQIARRLAQVELELDNLDEALKLAQRALNLATKQGEQTEIGLGQVLIGEIFAARDNFESAVEYALTGLETLRVVGDPYDIARTLMCLADIYIRAGDVNRSAIDKAFDEAFRLFNKLRLFYWSAEVRFRHGVYSCQHSDISSGFRKLQESERIFDKISERAKIRSIRLFMRDLSKQAVAVSLSAENEFKIFGNYFTDSEYQELKSGHVDEIIDILGKRARAHRVIVYNMTNDNGNQIVTGLNLTDHQKKRFIQQFNELIGEEINADKPTLILDSQRDPFINELLKNGENKITSSVIVVPLILGGEVTGYIYLDRLSSGGKLAPFGQRELNFAVGFADLISLKMAEYDRVLLEEDNKRLKAQLLETAVFPNIITQNKEMLEMLARVQQVVDSNISIAIEGETGCGKDLLAKTIHYSSNRREKRFISVNCAALPETLLESELFGHKRGAFTGADRDKVGLFEEADGGTFFLDEIADMPLSIQAKVLRILEEKEIVPLGETKARKVDVRIISATNRDLKTEMEAGQFRQDLYYRLTALCFRIPPLRERREDIPLLIRHFAGDRVRFSPEAIRMLVGFEWPGNIRELENEVKKLVLLAGDSGMVDIPLLSSKISVSAQAEDTGKLELNTDVHFNKEFSLYDYLAEYERRFIIKALRDQSGVKKHAAAFLNIPESTLRLKIKQYDIDLDNLKTVH
ncbi:MAG: sigma 54-interacting transcriptional regulator [Candidatus Zixiibacteriota bacterium]|nr:MAG: sigma 54-interacting transcriptional regulator [candidate division Zixibacteria bacterium]